LKVVGQHEVLGDAVAEHLVDELAEVLRRLVVALRLRLHEPGEALVGHFLGEVADVVLERVGDPIVEHPHPALAHVELVVLAHQVFEALVVVLVVREHHVAAHIPRKPCRVGVAAGEPADVGEAVVHVEVLVAELLQPVTRAEPRRTRPENDNLFFHVGLPW
jgi:hypothetical protein